MTGWIRWLILCATESMTADAPTKAMVSPALMKRPCRVLQPRRAPHDVAFPTSSDQRGERHFDLLATSFTMCPPWQRQPTRLPRRTMWMAMVMASMAATASAFTVGPSTTSTASSTTSSSSPTTTTSWDDWRWLFTHLDRGGYRADSLAIGQTLVASSDENLFDYFDFLGYYRDDRGR